MLCTKFIPFNNILIRIILIFFIVCCNKDQKLSSHNRTEKRKYKSLNAKADNQIEGNNSITKQDDDDEGILDNDDQQETDKTKKETSDDIVKDKEVEDNVDEQENIIETNPKSDFGIKVELSEPKILRSEGDDTTEVPTVRFSNIKGVSVLPTELELMNKNEYKSRDESMAFLAEKDMINKLNPSCFPGNLLFAGDNGRAILYKVNNYQIKERTFISAELRERVVKAAQRNGRYLDRNSKYNSVAILEFLRNPTPLKEIFFTAKLKINKAKLQEVCPLKNCDIVNNSSESDKEGEQEKIETDENKITPNNTYLQLIKFWIPKVLDGKKVEFKIESGTQEVDFDTIAGYDSTIRDSNGSVIQSGSNKVYVKVMATYDWIGSLADIDGAQDYQYGSFNRKNYRGLNAKSFADWWFKDKMIFASKKYVNISKEKIKSFEWSEDQSRDSPVAERFMFWRFILGGVCIGLMRPQMSISEALKEAVLPKSRKLKR